MKNGGGAVANFIREKIARFIEKFFPSKQFRMTINYKYLTHDEEYNKRLKKEKEFQTMSLVTVKYFVDQGKVIRNNPNLPNDFKLLVLVGSEDKLTVPAESKKYFDAADILKKTFKSYKGAYMGLLNEPEFKNEVYKDIIEWILNK